MIRSPFVCRLEPRVLLAAGPASLVKDINTNTASSDPSVFVALNGATLFEANDGVHGVEWFRAGPGPGGGASLVRDIHPGEAGSLPGPTDEIPPPYAVAGRTLFFCADDGTSGAELWKTDGTAEGTVLVKDIAPGAAGSGPKYFAAMGDTVYFAANDGTTGYELWKSDGTPGGTVLVKDFTLGRGGSTPVPLAAVGGRMLIAGPGASPTLSRTLWASDGTAEGTVVLKQGVSPRVNPDPANPQVVRTDFVFSEGLLYFPAAAADTGGELWRTDGTPEGTLLVADVRPGRDSGIVHDVIDVNGTVYFVATTTGTDASLLRTSATAAGGAEVVGRVGTVSNTGAVFSKMELGTAGGKLFVYGFYPARDIGLFVHDPASPPGTPLTYLKPIIETPLDGTDLMAALDGKIFFMVRNGQSRELWTSDGTPGGTVRLHAAPGFDSGTLAYPRWPLRATAANGAVYFAGGDAGTGIEPWRTDGTAAGTTPVADVNTVTLTGGGSAPVFVDGRTVFFASQPGRGTELWTTDGTEAGTVPVVRVNPWGTPATNYDTTIPTGVVFKDRIYFAADAPGTSTSELWASDGTAAGTVLVKDINTSPAGSSNPLRLTATPSRLFFVADDGVHGEELWATDGAAEGTTLVKDIYPNAGESIPVNLTAVGDVVYFTADDGVFGRELWKSDGTPQGTVRVSDIAPGSASGFVYPYTLTAFGNRLVFTRGNALWVSDGTAEGTMLVKALPGTAEDFKEAAGKLFFRAPKSDGTPALWVTDGTPAGTAIVGDAVPALAAVAPTYTAVYNGALYIFYGAGNRQWQIWRTDGTAAGTALVSTITAAANSAGSAIPLGEAGGLLYFRAAGPEGLELWRTDGTPEGTALVQDVNPGPAGSTPGNFAVAGGRIYFNADDGSHGREKWSMPLFPPTTVSRRALFYNDSAFDGADPAGNAADMGAVAPNVQALLPGGGPGGPANVSNYTKGINGLLLQFFSPGASHPQLTADDLEFKVGTGGDPSTWAAAPAPAAISVIPVPGPNSVYAITWPDGAIRNTWLQVTVKANANTGLAAPDVFSFGNLVGETGDSATGIAVSALDLAAVRRGLNTAADLASRLDVDRNGRVTALDLAAVKANLNRRLSPQTEPAVAAPAPGATLVAGSAAGPESATPPRVWDEQSADLLGRSIA